MSLNRRDFLKLAGVGAALVGASPTRAALASVQHSIPELMGKPKGKRLVILGASFGGINAALTVKRLLPDTQVVLLDKAPFFISCPATLEYLFGMVSLDTITRGYTSLHERGLEFVRTTILALDRDKKMVVCADGTVDYDYLLVATGVRMAYEDVPGLTERPRANLCLYDKGSPLIDLHHRIAAFQGGDVVVSIPNGPYKCPPGPYEYALLWADYIKKKRLKGKVTMVDPRPKPIPPALAPGFLKAMEANKDVLTYHPHTRLLRVGPEDRTVETEAGKLRYDVLSVIPPNKTMPFLVEAGLGDPFTEVNPQTFRSTKDETIYALGDNADTPFTKSAFCATTSAKIAGRHIAKVLGAKIGEPGAPSSICWPLVSMDSAMMISVTWSYEKDKEGNIQAKSEGTTDNEAKPSYLHARRGWEMGLLQQMFSS